MFEIEVSKETVDRAFAEVYGEIAKTANIPGFRVGKAPAELVRKHYAKSANDEVLKRLIPEAYRQALAEHQTNPVGLPEITDVIFANSKAMTFKARVETRPKFRLKDYKAVKVTKKKAAIKEEDIEKTIQDIKGLNAKYVAVEDRPVQMGDYAVSDLECFVDGKPAHKKRENLWLFIDKDSLLPGLAEKVVGMKGREEKDIEVAVPEKYPDKDMAGKKAVYHILVKEIKKRVLPEADDEFAKDLGKTSLEDLKREIARELEAGAKTAADLDAEHQLLNKLMDDNVFNVPKSLVARQIDHMAENAKSQLQQKGFKREDLDGHDDEFKAKFKDDAVRQVRLLFILDEIADNEHIEVNDEDVNIAYRAIAAQTGKGEEEVRRYYEKDDLADSLKDKIKEEKTVKFLMDNAQITEA